MTPDLANDLLYTDGLEEVRVYFAGTDRSRVIPHALRAAVSVREAAASGGAYTTQDTKFSLMLSEFDSDPLEVGGIIEACDKTELWSVYGVDKARYAGQVRAWCKRGVVLGSLTDNLRIQAPRFTKSDDLVEKVAWTDVLTLQGKIQEVSSELVVEEQRRRVKVTHRIFVPARDTLHGGQRVLDANGSVYHILRVTGKDMLGDLVVLDCELARRPLGA